MTRINVVPPEELSVKHLIAEYREITRVPGNLTKSLNRKIPFNLNEIPSTYTLGKGHVKFFYNKMFFLQRRFESLVKEMVKRGYNPLYRDSSIFIPSNMTYYNDYTPTKEAIDINRKRIKERST